MIFNLPNEAFIAQLLDGISETNCCRTGKEVESAIKLWLPLRNSLLVGSGVRYTMIPRSGKNAAVLVLEVLGILWVQSEEERILKNKGILFTEAKEEGKSRKGKYKEDFVSALTVINYILS